MTTIVDLPMLSDTMVQDNAPTTNNNSSEYLATGESSTGSYIFRSLIKIDFSSIPAGQNILSATLKMTPVIDDSSNARTMYAHRILRDVVFAEATWNIYKTGSNWGTGGCSNSSSDYDGAVILGSATQPASPTLNSADSFTMSLTASEIQKLYDGTLSNYGIALFVSTQSNDEIIYASTNNATSTYRPKVTVEYESTSSIKKFSGVAYASIKKISGVAIADIKKLEGV